MAKSTHEVRSAADSEAAKQAAADAEAARQAAADAEAEKQAAAASDAALQKVLQSFVDKAKARLPALGDSVDPISEQVKAKKAIGQLQEAAKDKTPRLLLYEGNPLVPWVAVLTALVDRSVLAASQPGARTMRPKVPEQLQIDPAIADAVEAHHRVVQIVDSDDFDTAEYEQLRLQVLGNRHLVGGQARWQIETSSTINGIEALGDKAPAALREVLPMLRAALARLLSARPQTAGRPSAADEKPIYSADARQAALAVQVALKALKAWSGATALKVRNGHIVGIISPRRATDTAPTTPPADAAKDAAKKDESKMDTKPAEGASDAAAASSAASVHGKAQANAETQAASA